MSAGRTYAVFVDEIDAIHVEGDWAANLDNKTSPFRAETHLHQGEGGATTGYYQNAMLVGMSTRMRDEHNRTILVLVTFAPTPAK